MKEIEKYRLEPNSQGAAAFGNEEKE